MPTHYYCVLILFFQGSYENGRLKNFQTTEILPIEELQNDIEVQNINIQDKCTGTKFKGCISQDKALIKEGEALVYENSNDEVLIYDMIKLINITVSCTFSDCVQSIKFGFEIL